MTTTIERTFELAIGRSQSFPVGSPVQDPGTRDKLQWPFLQTSIWNMPLGQSAVLAPGPGWTPANSTFIDKTYEIQVSGGDPFVSLYQSSNWINAVGGTLTLLGTFQIPDSFTLPDRTVGNSPNASCVFIQPDGETILMLVGVVRPTPGGPIYAFRYSGDSYTEHLSTGAGSHGGHASQLNAMGGALRAQDFAGGGIHHALDIELYENMCYKNGGSAATSFVYPAIGEDGYYASAYGIANPSLPAYCKIGMLMALRRTLHYSDFTVTTPIGQWVFDAFQNHGAYATDSSAWDAANINVRNDAITALNNAGGFSQTTRDEISRMIGGLWVVTNNSPTSIGGGGTLPAGVGLAPPFAP